MHGGSQEKGAVRHLILGHSAISCRTFMLNPQNLTTQSTAETHVRTTSRNRAAWA